MLRNVGYAVGGGKHFGHDVEQLWTYVSEFRHRANFNFDECGLGVWFRAKLLPRVVKKGTIITIFGVYVYQRSFGGPESKVLRKLFERDVAFQVVVSWH